MVPVSWFLLSLPRQYHPTGKDGEGKPIQYSQFLPVPYNLDIELNIISKNQDDGLQILEQILPNFHPSLNVSIEVIDETHEERDIAIVLNGVGYTDDYEGDYYTETHSAVDTELHSQDIPLRTCRRSARHPQDYSWITAPTSSRDLQSFVTLQRSSLPDVHLSHATRSILPRRCTRLWNSIRTYCQTIKISSG